MKIFRNKMLTLALLSIVKDSSDDIENRNHRAENSCHTEKPKNLAIFVAQLTLFIINAFSANHSIKLFVLLSVIVNEVCICCAK